MAIINMLQAVPDNWHFHVIVCEFAGT